ncbi:Ig-like domain-containing protein [Wenyingzhuangia sp. chi5]|uniref:Ig-like domain-containing protein n=1 Tax=Wenyingzhuangia gilva TaxID=3057677 RepID=A0ABT8VMX4_9FLAO|nr:Ig-like domain-containing protein [Wenyingzhuangia sp. chi5]MDO3693320.1 Ig-like domain-containing protein [Wenyingzhuangia sp. chi5]
MKLLKLVFLLLFVGLNSCIQEDIVDDAVPEELRIISSVNTLKVGDVVKLQASYFNNVGEKENKNIVWETSNSNVLFIDALTTNITALAEGTATITVKTTGSSGELTDSEIIMVVKDGVVVMPSENTKKGTIAPTASYVAAGDFEISKTTNGIQIILDDNYVADESLPGFALFLTNNPNSLANALQIDAYDDVDGTHYKGAFTYILDGVGINDYQYLVQWCRPFSILVGKATITDK